MLEAIVGYLSTHFVEIMMRLTDFLVQPFKNHEMVWIIIPITITILVMEFYYSTYNKEEIGWNTATANSLVLVFVSMDLFRFLSQKGALTFSRVGSYDFSATLLVTIVLLEGIFMFFLNFGHRWPKFLAFSISSQLTINLIAYTSIIVIYSGIPINTATFFSSLIFFIIVNIGFFFMRMFYRSKNKNY